MLAFEEIEKKENEAIKQGDEYGLIKYLVSTTLLNGKTLTLSQERAIKFRLKRFKEARDYMLNRDCRLSDKNLSHIATEVQKFVNEIMEYIKNAEFIPNEKT